MQISKWQKEKIGIVKVMCKCNWIIWKRPSSLLWSWSRHDYRIFISIVYKQLFTLLFDKVNTANKIVPFITKQINGTLSGIDNISRFLKYNYEPCMRSKLMLHADNLLTNEWIIEKIMQASNWYSQLRIHHFARMLYFNHSFIPNF